MTEKQFIALVDKWQGRLNMENWRIAIIFNDRVYIGGRSVFMKMSRSELYERGALEVSRAALNQDLLEDCIERDLFVTNVVTFEQFLEESVVHELLHLSIRDLMETGDIARPQLAAPALELWDAAWRRAEEALVERLSIAIAGNWGES